jgi:hypothetical protein
MSNALQLFYVILGVVAIFGAAAIVTVILNYFFDR